MKDYALNNKLNFIISLVGQRDTYKILGVSKQHLHKHLKTNHPIAKLSILGQKIDLAWKQCRLSLVYAGDSKSSTAKTLNRYTEGQLEVLDTLYS